MCLCDKLVGLLAILYFSLRRKCMNYKYLIVYTPSENFSLFINFFGDKYSLKQNQKIKIPAVLLPKIYLC